MQNKLKDIVGYVKDIPAEDYQTRLLFSPNNHFSYNRFLPKLRDVRADDKLDYDFKRDFINESKSYLSNFKDKPPVVKEFVLEGIARIASSRTKDEFLQNFDKYQQKIEKVSEVADNLRIEKTKKEEKEAEQEVMSLYSKLKEELGWSTMLKRWKNNDDSPKGI